MKQCRRAYKCQLANSIGMIFQWESSILLIYLLIVIYLYWNVTLCYFFQGQWIFSLNRPLPPWKKKNIEFSLTVKNRENLRKEKNVHNSLGTQQIGKVLAVKDYIRMWEEKCHALFCSIFFNCPFPISLMLALY